MNPSCHWGQRYENQIGTKHYKSLLILNYYFFKTFVIKCKLLLLLHWELQHQFHCRASTSWDYWKPEILQQYDRSCPQCAPMVTVLCASLFCAGYSHTNRWRCRGLRCPHRAHGCSLNVLYLLARNCARRAAGYHIGVFLHNKICPLSSGLRRRGGRRKPLNLCGCNGCICSKILGVWQLQGRIFHFRASSRGLKTNSTTVFLGIVTRQLVS